MPGLAELAALIVAGGSALAAVNRSRPLAVLGVAIALVAAPLVGARAPDLLSLAFREVAALTGIYLLRIAATAPSGGSAGETVEERIGAGVQARSGRPVFPAVFVVGAFVGVIALALPVDPGRGPLAGLAAAAAAAIAALALGDGDQDLLSGGLGAVLLVLAASLAVGGLVGVVGPLQHAVIGAALLGVAAAAAFLGTGARSAVAYGSETPVEPASG